jgi:SAM-dependent methyltransferase
MKRNHQVHVVGMMAIVLIGLSCGCRNRETDGAAAKAQRIPAAPRETTSPIAGSHDPSHPPIDCPLRKQGIDPTHMRPFEDVEKYIAFLDRADRAAWQKPDEVVAALGLKGTETVFDLGAGSGYFSFRFAQVLSSGKVIAADTEAEMIRHVHHRAMSEGAGNIEAKLIQPNDPGVSLVADVVFVCDVLHHVADRPAWFAKLKSEMKSSARLVLIEFKEGNLPEGPPEGAKIPRAQLIELATGAGFALDLERKDLLPYQVFLVFKKP